MRPINRPDLDERGESHAQHAPNAVPISSGLPYLSGVIIPRFGGFYANRRSDTGYEYLMTFIRKV